MQPGHLIAQNYKGATMQTLQNEPLSAHTSLHVGGPAREYLVTQTPQELAQAVSDADQHGDPLLVLGQGSNVLVADEGFSGVVVHPEGGHVSSRRGPEPGQVLVDADAAMAWDDVVAYSVGMGLAGMAPLSGIPGLIGSACMQNIGAYGQEAGSLLHSIHVLDRRDGRVHVLRANQLQMGYRTSVLRESLDDSYRTTGMTPTKAFPTPRWVVLAATFSLTDSSSTVVSHPQLARAIGVEPGQESLGEDVREKVLAVRGSKAMLAEGESAQDHDFDRWSSGSFFTNPLLSSKDAQALPEDAPRYPAAGGTKTSAAWLIEHAGFTRGFGVHGQDSAATLSQQHVLAITNRGHATASDLLELARTVREGVHEKFGIYLEPETVLVGAEL